MDAEPMSNASNTPFANVGDAPIFEAVPAVRKAKPAQIALWGPPDAGKTVGALRLARGLVGPAGKIVVIDAEEERATIYAGMYGGFFHINMTPPYTPERYLAAHKAAIDAGADVVIVDTYSHVWAGEGGVIEQADASQEIGLDRWKAPKKAYNQMRYAMYRSPVHMIYCIRAKEKFVQTVKGRAVEIVSAGYAPICDGLFIHELHIAVQLQVGTHRPMFPVKIPDPIMGAITPGELITEKAGEYIADWVKGGAPIDHRKEALHSYARSVAMDGTAAFIEWWKGQPAHERAMIKLIIAELKALASQADDAMLHKAAAAIDSQNSGGNPLDDAFTPSRGKAA